MARTKSSDMSALEDLLGLHDLNNMFGKLQADVRKRLVRCFDNPKKHWDDSHGIILRDGPGFGFGLTLWQAWIATDPTAPRTGKTTDMKGRTVKPWSKTPTQENIFEAIRYAATAEGKRR